MAVLSVGAVHQARAIVSIPCAWMKKNAQIARAAVVEIPPVAAPPRCCNVSAGNQFEERGKRNAAQHVAEENEKEERPKKRHEPIGVLLQRRAKNFNPQKLQDRFEEVFRPRRRLRCPAVAKNRGKISSISIAASSAISIWLVK